MQKSTRIRRNEIEKKIIEDGEAKVLDLANHFQVTKETIRTDLQYLEQKGVLYRTHGGATRREGNYDVPFEIRNNEYVYEKRTLARKVLDFIPDNTVIYIDPSTTAIYLGVLLKSKKNLTIVTNSISILSYLQDSDHTILITGGEYFSHGRRMGGIYSTRIVESLSFDVCIMGMDGCKGIDGPANMPYDEMLLNKTVISRSDKRILVCDLRKFECRAHHQYAKFSDFDYLITGKLNEQQRKRCNVKKIIELDL